MAKTRQQKEEDLQELVDRLKDAKSVVLADYRGTTVKEIDSFRRALGAEAVTSKVYKISLIKKAFEANGIDASTLDYKTPVILSVSQDDEVAPARIAKNISKDVKTISILSGVLDGQFASREQVLALADLPSKDELRAKVVGTINAPVSGFVNVLAGNLRGLINVLQAASQK
ncbi:MAG TPA: 50S ribosomal protein L10 [Candidatus Doudnabacteria bacterium]|nr:50S ribosomal protein L10 [Candidatus Doudnabacteria bacterium]